MSRTILVTMLLAALPWSAAADDQIPSSVAGSIKDRLRDEFRYGYCAAEAKKIDIKNLMFLKNTEIRLSLNPGYALIGIEGESLRIEKHNNSGSLVDTKIIDVDKSVLAHAKQTGDIDIEMSFVLLDGSIAVFWKETFMHQSYRQGIFKLENDNLQWVCEGTAGKVSLR
jgi:hypothetical protein